MALFSGCAVLALVGLHVGALAAAWGTRVLAGSRAQGFMHFAAGIVLFAIALGLIFLIDFALAPLSSSKREFA